MEDEKLADKLLDRILMVLMPYDQIDVERIKAKLTVVLDDYQICPKQEALVVYTEGKNDYYLRKFLLAKAVAFAACRMIILNHDALSDMDEDTIEAVYGDGIYNDEHDLDTAVLMENAQVNPMKMLMVLLLALTEPVNHRVHDTEWLGGFYKCIKDDESVYRGIYSALDGIGYEISDMEKSLLDGTHPSYEGAEEEL